MRHKHGIRGGNPSAATSVRDAYGFEVCVPILAAATGPAEAVSLLIRTHLPPVHAYTGQERYAQSIP